MTEKEELHMLRRFVRSSMKLLKNPELLQKPEIAEATAAMLAALDRYFVALDFLEARKKAMN